jgi:uncharacterized membrane protein (TIGR02234 family)
VRPASRELAAVCAALLVAAVALWASTGLAWYRLVAQVPLRGPVPVAFTGGEVRPVLPAVAALALAAVAAVPATAGALRRALGGLLAVAGTGVLVSVVLTWAGGSPFATDAARPAVPEPPPGIPLDALRHQPLEVTAAPWAAVLGALALLVAGGLTALREPRLPRMGARYAGASRRRREPDRDRSWWEALDRGDDPTAPGGAAERPGSAGPAAGGTAPGPDA